MSLRDLVELLRTKIPSDGHFGGADKRMAVEELAAESTIFPPNSQLEKISLLPGYKDNPYYLSFTGYFEKAFLEVIPLINALFEQMCKKELLPKTLKARIYPCWPTEVFDREVDIGDFKVEIRGYFHDLDSTKMRIGCHGKSSILDAKLEGNNLKISAEGEYSALLPRLINEINPESATIRLSKDDAQRWIKKVSWLKRPALKMLLRPEKKTFVVFQGGGISFGEVDIIEVDIPVFLLPACAEAIGKPLINEGNAKGSFIVNLTKVFSQRNQILPALQNVVRALGEFETRTLFNYSLLTTSRAKRMLEKEIGLLDRVFQENRFSLERSYWQWLPLVRRLAREYFGERSDVITLIDKPLPGFEKKAKTGDLMWWEKTSPAEYLAFLRGFGFEYIGHLKEEDLVGYMLKEVYLFEFFRQSYAENPDRSVEKFRQWYVNPAPTINIAGDMEADASVISKISLPSQAFLSGLSIWQERDQGDSRLSIWDSSREETRLEIGAPLGPSESILLDLQNDICEKMGIIFQTI